MAITVKHNKVSLIPDAGDDSLIEPSDWNADHTLTGLGTMAEQNANAVAITGGTISGVTLPASNITGTLGVPNGGTGATTLTGYVKGTGTTAMTAAATIPNTDITGLGTASTKDAGAALGVATLDAGGKVPVSELPAAVLGALSYQGTWDAATNTPTLASSVGVKGYYYVVSVAGNTNLNGITDWLVGDWAVFNGSAWQKVDNTDSVVSVNGQTGAVTITLAGLGAGTIATQNANSVAITGGAINGTTIGATTPSTGAFNGATVVGSTTAGNALVRIEQNGSGYALLVEDSANPDATPFVVHESGGVSVGNTLDAGAGNLYVAGNMAANIITAVTEFTGSKLKATSSAGLALQNSAGTTQMSMGAGGGDNLSINVSTNLNGTNAQIDISPTGTGHVHIKPTGSGAVEIAPTSAGTINNMVIGGGTPLAGSFTNLAVTGTLSFDADQGTNGQVLTSQGAGNTPKWETNASGTVTSVSGTGTVSGISLSGTVTTSGSLTLGGTLDLSKPPAIGSDTPSTGAFTNLSVTGTASFDGSQGTAGQVLTSAGAGNTPAWTTPTTGTVTSVTGTAPIASSGGATPAISMAASGVSTDGYLKSADWTIFNNKAPSVTYTTNYVPFGQGTTTPNQSASFTYTTGTGALRSPAIEASNGLVVNNLSINTSYSIPSGYGASSVGPVVVASGVTITVPSGSRWVVL